MKRIATFIVLAACVFGAGKTKAQQDAGGEIKTIFSKDSEISGFGSFDMKLSDFNEDKALFLGGHGGVILNKHFIIGIGGYGITTNNTFDGITPNKELDLYSGYGGIVLGYVIAPREVIHISFPLLVGAGGVEVVDKSLASDIDDRGVTVERSAFFVVEPTAQVEVNITKFFRFAVVGGYRLVQGSSLDINRIKDEDLTSWTAGVSFKFGKF